MEKSGSIKSLAVALCKAQSEMGGVIKGKDNPFFKSKYSDLSSVVAAIKEPFSNNGLSYVQFPIEENGRIGIETILMHDSGEFLSQSFTVQLTKQDAQGAGSALTYCRRYSLQAVAGIPSEDDDGNRASKKTPVKPATINENQITAIRSLFHSGMSEQQFLQQWNIPTMQDIQQASYDQVSNWLIESKKISITIVTEK